MGFYTGDFPINPHQRRNTNSFLMLKGIQHWDIPNVKFQLVRHQTGLHKHIDPVRDVIRTLVYK